MSDSLPKFLTHKQQRLQHRINEILAEKEEMLKEVHQDLFDIEIDEKGLMFETQNNIIRLELNKKLKIYDESFNNLVRLVNKMIQKLIILHTEISTIITITIFLTLLVSTIIGGIVYLVTKF